MSGDSKNNKKDYSLTDGDILNLLRDGSPESESKVIEVLYRRLLEGVRSWVNAKGGSTEDGHDALTEALIAFVCIFRKGKYGDQGKLGNFIFRIGQFKYYDLCRKRGSGGKGISIVEIFPEGIPAEIEEDHLEKAEEDLESAKSGKSAKRKEKFGICLNQVGVRCKERLIRYWVMGQSHEEIAKAMGDASADVSKVMKGKCQKKLKMCMESRI